MRPTVSDAARRCTSTGLRIVAHHDRRVVRIAKPSYGALGPQVREMTPTREAIQSWGRYDATGAATVYAAANPETAFREVLAYLAPSPGLRNTRLSDVFTEEGSGDHRTLIEAITADWDDLWSIHPKKIVQGWREARALYRLMLPSSGWFVDIAHQDSLDALNHGLARLLHETGKGRLTLGDLCGEDRRWTVLAARWIYEQILDDGSLAHGLEFSSKHGSNAACWAVWLRRVADGAEPISEPTRVLHETRIEPPDRNAPLERAATAFGLRVL